MKLPLYYVWLNDVLKLICLLSALFLGWGWLDQSNLLAVIPFQVVLF
jgi:hypothetical protein